MEQEGGGGRWGQEAGDRERLRSWLPLGVGKWAPMQKSGACQRTECRGERWECVGEGKMRT